MQEPVQSRRSEFVERWSRAEVINARLGSILIAMIMIFLCLTAALIYICTKPRPIYYVPSATLAGAAYSQADPKAVAAVFTASWALNWSNFTPANVEEAYKRAERFMSPHLLNLTKSRLKNDIEEVKRNNISSMFSLTQEPLVQESQDGFSVLLQGDKGVYVGKAEIKLQKMLYHIQLRPSAPTDWNPYGFMIEDVYQEVNG